MSRVNSSEKKGAQPTESQSPVDPKHLERMEALLQQSAQGIHILFDRDAISKVFEKSHDDRDFLNFQKMKLVQDVMTELIQKKSYFEKVDYLQTLDQEAFEMLVRTYFHLVENSVRSQNDFQH